MKKTIIITKEVLRKDFLSCYGGLLPTPNIDRMAREGTKFNNWYITGPSTIMSLTSMFSGLYAFQFTREIYDDTEAGRKLPQGTKRLFSELREAGLKTKVLTSQYYNVSLKRTNCFNVEEFKLVPRDKDSSFDNFKTEVEHLEDFDVLYTHFQYNLMCNTIKDNPELQEKYRLKARMGYTTYGLDEYIGFLMKTFPDARIILSADHGMGQGEKPDYYSYAFHLYEQSINCPMIIWEQYKEDLIDAIPVSARNLKNIVLNKHIEYDKYIVSETAYVKQPQKVVMFRKDNFKYIFKADSGEEELFDTRIGEHFNFIGKKNANWSDVNRNKYSKALVKNPLRTFEKPYTTIFYYGYWDEIYQELEEFRKLKDLWIRNDIEKLTEAIK